MSSIQTIATALPPHRYDTARLLQESQPWLADLPSEREKFERFMRSTRTDTRYFAFPVERILQFRGQRERAALFESNGTPLGERSLQAAIDGAGLTADQLGTLIFTSCSCPVIPSIDGLLIERLGLSPHIHRAPIYQYGCAGGVAGLGLASRMAESGHTVALTSVELCSLVFHENDHSTGHLVGSALFGDGSATAIVSPNNSGLTFKAAQSTLLPGTRYLMGYDIHDDGSHLRLAKELPDVLAEKVPQIVSRFLAEQSITSAAVDWWLFHPGGIKILDLLERTFCKDAGRSRWSREILRDVGNLSSATVLFVLKRFLDEGAYSKGDNVVLLGIGPGLTVELVLFQVL